VNKGILFIFIGLSFSCSPTGITDDDPQLARVYEKYLYQSDLANIMPAGLSPEDSVLIMKDHVEKWVHNQLLLYQADLNLSEEEKNVEQQIEDYRASLLIFIYEQGYIKQKLDTLITVKEIEDYYNNYSSNFILNNHLLKGLFIRVSRSAPEIWKVRRWYRSGDPEDLKELESYCFEHASEYKYFEENWIYLSDILKEMPKIYMRPDNLLRYRKNFEVKDTNDYYFLKISDYRLESSVAPLEFIQEDIKSILLNKRKIQLIQELESNIYNDALNRGNFSIY
jgi:hypothetical protein